MACSGSVAVAAAPLLLLALLISSQPGLFDAAPAPDGDCTVDAGGCKETEMSQLLQMTREAPQQHLHKKCSQHTGTKCITDHCCEKAGISHAHCVQRQCVCQPGFHQSWGECHANGGCGAGFSAECVELCGESSDKCLRSKLAWSWAATCEDSVRYCDDPCWASDMLECCPGVCAAAGYNIEGAPCNTGPTPAPAPAPTPEPTAPTQAPTPEPTAPTPAPVSKGPVAWCTSGGGFRAMAAGMGFANAFNRAGLFDRPDLAALGSNSGGSWFLTQFAYDADFHKNTLDPDPDVFSAFVMKKYEYWYEVVTKKPRLNQTVLSPILSAAIRCLTGEENLLSILLCPTALKWCQANPDDCSGLVDKLKAVKTAEAYDYNWLKLVRAFYDPETAERPATEGGRPVMPGPSLHFQITGMPQVFVKNASDDQARAAAAGPSWPRASEAMFEPGEVGVDGSFIFNPALYPQAPESTSAEDSIALLASKQAPDFSDIEDIALPSDLNVATVGAMSGAAAGLAASGLLISQGLQAVFGAAFWQVMTMRIPLLHGTLNDVIEGNLSVGLDNLAICGHPQNADGLCEYPATRYWDGGFSDDMAAALTVGNLQMRYSSGTPLKLILTDQNGASNGMKNLAPLFGSKDGPRPGQFYKASFGMTRASPQVFDRNWDELSDWTNISSPDGEGDGPMQYLIEDVRTVDNPNFGVQANMTVRLLMLFTPSKTDNLESTPEAYTDFAKYCSAAAVSAVVEKFLAEE
eukprot:CAMPEP_0115361746 /NCGR_PEP_ID=MMETSP0270-20121206/102357_1 /TAXON_ID=71861 /ORGANISM="Scrippsiella trochoidea, Strain CCMP3099" /LENGTH=746 /DNA_ID=CAMNT_0002784313 /DNA_START=11 /DNA_END=2252 /DNA_ORIENTATION=-